MRRSCASVPSAADSFQRVLRCSPALRPANQLLLPLGSRRSTSPRCQHSRVWPRVSGVAPAAVCIGRTGPVARASSFSTIQPTRALHQRATAAGWSANRRRGFLSSMPLLGAIDQGTSSTRFIVFDGSGRQVASKQVDISLVTPEPGWLEQDPRELLSSVKACMADVEQQLGPDQKLAAIGLTNQRETTIAWDRTTGEPLHNAIVWSDQRTSQICKSLSAALPGGRDHLRPATGLPISTYFSATKMKWLIDNVPAVAAGLKAGTCLFGTVDAWLLWCLTGRQAHVTDVTNASRTMLMNLESRDWDAAALEAFGVPRAALPDIHSNAERYGELDAAFPFAATPLTAALGDQQAAMVGQMCFAKGQAKNTYGTGCFMLMNTGAGVQSIVPSDSGLLTTACFQLGKDAELFYALEGSIAVAGSAVSWLKDNMGIVSSSQELSKLAATVDDTAGAYFVPALSGLFAPRWREDARGAIVGLTQYTKREHLCRAVLEAVSCQTREIFDAMRKDAAGETALAKLRVDGGMSKSDTLCQIQANVLGITVERPADVEATALGAAIAAGIGVGVWKDTDEVVEALRASTVEDFKPAWTDEQRAEHFRGWEKAVQRSLGWVE